MSPQTIDTIRDALHWAQQQLGKHTRPSPIDKALAELDQSRAEENSPASTDPIGTESSSNRGFQLIEFCDEYDNPCSIQESSRAVCENADGTVNDPLGWIWLGINNAKPQIMKADAFRMGLPVPPGPITGWMPYPLPPEVSLTTRMHLNENQVRGLVARLTRWLETGSLTTKPPTD